MSHWNFYEIAALGMLGLFSLYIILRYIVITIKKRNATKKHYNDLWRNYK